MNLLKIALCVCVGLALWAVPAAGQGAGTCLVVDNHTGRTMSFSVDGWPGTWTWQPNDPWAYVVHNGADVKSSTGGFSLRGANGTHLDESNTTWAFHAESTDNGACNGSWWATFHN